MKSALDFAITGHLGHVFANGVYVTTIVLCEHAALGTTRGPNRGPNLEKQRESKRLRDRRSRARKRAEREKDGNVTQSE